MEGRFGRNEVRIGRNVLVEMEELARLVRNQLAHSVFGPPFHGDRANLGESVRKAFQAIRVNFLYQDTTTILDFDYGKVDREDDDTVMRLVRVFKRTLSRHLPQPYPGRGPKIKVTVFAERTSVIVFHTPLSLGQPGLIGPQYVNLQEDTACRWYTQETHVDDYLLSHFLYIWNRYFCSQLQRLSGVRSATIWIPHIHCNDAVKCARVVNKPTALVLGARTPIDFYFYIRLSKIADGIEHGVTVLGFSREEQQDIVAISNFVADIGYDWTKYAFSRVMASPSVVDILFHVEFGTAFLNGLMTSSLCLTHWDLFRTYLGRNQHGLFYIGSRWLYAAQNQKQVFFSGVGDWLNDRRNQAMRNNQGANENHVAIDAPP